MLKPIDPNLTGLERVRAALSILGLPARIVSPGTPMPTVRLAAAALGCATDQIIKTVVFSTSRSGIVIGIANGTRRVAPARLAAAAGVASLTLAGPDLVLEMTGYPAGGVSPIGIRCVDAPIVIDPAVLEQSIVYGGAGTEDDLLEIRTSDLVRATGGRIVQIAQPT